MQSLQHLKLRVRLRFGAAGRQLMLSNALFPVAACSGTLNKLRSEDSESGTPSTSSDNEDGDLPKKGHVDLTLKQLEAMHAVASNLNKDESTYATHGKSETRIKEALRNPICKCRCKIPMQLLLKICLAFWMLSKQGQDTVLWTIQHEHPGTKKDWYLGGLLLEPSLCTRICYWH